MAATAAGSDNIDNFCLSILIVLLFYYAQGGVAVVLDTEFQRFAAIAIGEIGDFLVACPHFCRGFVETYNLESDVAVVATLGFANLDVESVSGRGGAESDEVVVA